MNKHRQHQSCVFRTPLEARWAACLQRLGIKWEYEPMRQKQLAGTYVPDFFLPELGMWLEIKKETSIFDRWRYMDFTHGFGEPLLAIAGEPLPGRYSAQLIPARGKRGLLQLKNARFAENKQQPTRLWLSEGNVGLSLERASAPCKIANPIEVDSKWIQEAMTFASLIQ